YQRIEGTLGLWMLDPARTRQVLSNLVENALKYSPDGTRVELRAHATEAEGLVIEVTDEGIGLTSDQLERIFSAFGRASNVGSIQGLGMGLYVAREIAELHQGRLEASSDGPGRGTTMRLCFPATLRIGA